MNEERWDWSGPEEGDEVDLTVVLMLDGVEVLEVVTGTLTERRSIARRLVSLLNQGEVIPL
jgi:hypothetical protein